MPVVQGILVTVRQPVGALTLIRDLASRKPRDFAEVKFILEDIRETAAGALEHLEASVVPVNVSDDRRHNL